MNIVHTAAYTTAPVREIAPGDVFQLESAIYIRAATPAHAADPGKISALNVQSGLLHLFNNEMPVVRCEATLSVKPVG